MLDEFIAVLPWIYAIIQGIIIIIISISGVKYVRHEFTLQQQKVTYQKSQTTQTNVEETTNQYQMISKMNFCKLWFKIVWKMRSVYCAFVVHVFDVLTDVLVIIEWWNLEQSGTDIPNIDPKTMALCGIVVLLFHKFISTIVFWAKEKKITRCIL
eukprot:437760_1